LASDIASFTQILKWHKINKDNKEFYNFITLSTFLGDFTEFHQQPRPSLQTLSWLSLRPLPKTITLASSGIYVASWPAVLSSFTTPL
jgi:hypothetical protein